MTSNKPVRVVCPQITGRMYIPPRAEKNIRKHEPVVDLTKLTGRDKDRGGWQKGTSNDLVYESVAQRVPHPTPRTHGVLRKQKGTACLQIERLRPPSSGRRMHSIK